MLEGEVLEPLACLAAGLVSWAETEQRVAGRELALVVLEVPEELLALGYLPDLTPEQNPNQYLRPRDGTVSVPPRGQNQA